MSAAEVTTLTENYNKLQHDVNELRQSVGNMNSALNRIERSLVGDPEMMHTGIVETVRTNTKTISTMTSSIETIQKERELEESIKKNDRWWTGGIVAVTTGILTWLINFFTR